MDIYVGKFPVCYGQFYFLSETHWDGDLEECFSKQVNGLCGVSFPGVVFFITGLHTGNISLNLNLYDSEPPSDNQAEEIVEASINVLSSSLFLESWGGEVKKELGLTPGTYRIRYSAINFQKAEELGKFDEGDIELYSVKLWPAPYSSDEIIKVKSKSAQYWHDEVAKRQL